MRIFCIISIIRALRTAHDVHLYHEAIHRLVEDVDVEHSEPRLALCCQALKETGNADWSIPGGTEALGIP